MPYTDRPMVENKGASKPYPSGDAADSLIQSPDISEAGNPRQHSVRDIGMAREIIKNIIAAGRTRSIVNSRILAKYNAERPYDACKLEAEGLGWKQNFTTKPLPTMIEKVYPRFVDAVQGLKYLTNSTLSDKWENSVEKTELFRKMITDCIRARKGWRTFVEDIALDNSLFGYNIVAWLDEFSWFPKSFKQDESAVNDGTKAQPQFAQCVVLKETFMPHELFVHIKDKDDAKSAGWNIEETIKEINRASPTQVRDRMNVGGTMETWYQNAIRELTIGASYTAGASVIVVYSLLATEVNGKVSHYRLAGPEMAEIYSKDDRFKSPEDCLSFFTYQKGNGTLYGSKGIGRDIYELAGMLDRSRNEIVDRAILSGKTLIQGDIKRLHTFKMSVIGATVVIPNGWMVLEQRFDGNIEPFLKLDAYFSMLVDQLIGSTSPPAMGGQGEAFRSPAAWNLLASREEEGKDAKISRFLEQFVDMISTMQSRICREDTIDEDAKECRKKLLEAMTRKELDELADTPVAGTIRDLTPIQRQMVVALVAEKQGNPLYNQRQLQVEDLTARMSTDFAKRVLLPVNDPTEEVENTRMQLMEIALLAQGQPVPTSPRDNDEVHIKVLFPAAQQLASQLAAGAFHTEGLEAMLAHLTEHVNRAMGKGAKKENFLEILELVKKVGPAIAQLKELDAQAAQVSEQSAAHDAEGMLPEMGAPPMQ